MKITLAQPKLARALNYTSRAVSTKPNIPVLANIMIEVNRNEMKLAATNLDMGITMWIAGVVDTEGKLTVAGRFLADFITASGGDKVEITTKGNNLHVQAGSSQAEFQTIAASEFPVLPKAQGEPLFTASRADLVEALDKALFAAATDLASSRIQLTGVLLEMEEDARNKLTLVGLDSFRLSKKMLAVKSSAADIGQLIIPARSLAELSKILTAEAEEDEVKVYLSESKTQIIFQFAELELSIRLLEGPYPDYKRVLPSEVAFGFDVAKDELERALKIVSTFARSVNGTRILVDLDMESATLMLSSQVAELGHNETKLKVQNTTGSSDFKAAYSLHYLLDMVSHSQGETIHFESKGPLAPAVFTTKTDKDYTHIIMPLQREE